MKLGKTSRKNFTTLGMLLVAYIVLMICQSAGVLSSVVKGQLVPICAYVIMAISLNLTVGILGELSLGHAGFMSVGAFSGIIVTTILNENGAPDVLTIIAGIVVGGLCAALAGVLVGIPVLRLSGDYLAIVTLAFGEIIKSIFMNFYVGYDSAGLHVGFLKKTYELADGGKMIIDGPNGLNRMPRISTFTIGFVLLVICLVIVFNFVKSRTGRAVMALRDNRIAAESVGINVTKYKLLAFSISAGMAGMAGVLYTHNLSRLNASKFDFNLSILILVFVVLGGLGNMRGSIIAATLLTLLPELLREFSNYRMLVYAIVLILVMLATNNPTLKGYIKKINDYIKNLIKPKKDKKGDAVNG